MEGVLRTPPVDNRQFILPRWILRVSRRLGHGKLELRRQAESLAARRWQGGVLVAGGGTGTTSYHASTLRRPAAAPEAKREETRVESAASEDWAQARMASG